MNSSLSTKTRRGAQSSSLKDSEQVDLAKALQQRTDAMEAELRNGTAPQKVNQQVDIPSLDDMTSYLLSNEVMDKDNFSHYLPGQQKQGYEIPPMNPRENDFDKSQTLSLKAREKNEASFNQFNAEEGKKEIERLFKMAQSLASNGEYQQAINYYNRIVGLNEKSGSAWIAMGHCYAMMGQDQKALNSYQQALKSAPLCQKDEQLWYGIGLLYQKFEDWNNAETAFRNALRLEPSQNMKGEVLYNLGLVMKAKGDYPEAIKVMTNAILSEAFPPEKIIEILCQNGGMQEKMDDADGALQTYKYALMIQENNPRALLCAGWLCFQLDLFEQSLSYLTKAEMLLPNDGNITYVIARCHLKMKQHTTAYDCLHKCLSKDPTNSIYWSSLGILFAELMQLKQAYDCLSKALRNDPKIPEHFFNLGCLFELSNQQKDALGMYDKAIEANPNFQLALVRKRKILSDTHSTTLEVQFKHPPFTLPMTQDLKREKPLFIFAQVGQQSPFTAKGMLDIGKPNGLRNMSANESIAIRNSQANQNQERKFQQINQREGNNDQLHLLKPNQLENHKISLDNRSKNPKVPIGGLDSELNGLKMNRPLISEPSSTKLPSVQSLNSSISGLNSFSLTPNTFNNEPKNQGHNEAEEANSLLPGRSKTEDLLALVKGMSPQDFAKQLNGLQAVIAKNNNILQSNLLQNLNAEGLKPTKNISSPIVLKHNPQVLTLNESSKKANQPSANGAQNKTELKLTHKLNRSDDEEEVGVQKKIKTDNINKDEIIPSIGN